MNRIVVLILILLSAKYTFADDGSFNAMGNTLFPLQETVIKLKKEKLDLTAKNDTLHVDIYFEFFNPGAEKELTVGFVTPPAWNENLNEYELRHPQIKQFTVSVNGVSPKYKVYRIDSSGFRINDATVRGYDFVYCFKARFPHGKTIVKHTYSYQASTANLIGYAFDYRLTTGTFWANHEIEDFELNINMGNDIYFYLPYSFGKKRADWHIAGTGRLSQNPIKVDSDELGEGPTVRMVYVKKGAIQYRSKHFRPVSDLFFGVFSPYTELKYISERMADKIMFGKFNRYYYAPDVLKKEVAKLSNRQLAIYLNLPYARAGYYLKEEWLKKVFSNCIWYLPDKSAKKVFKPYYYDTEIKVILETEIKRRQNAKRNSP